MKDRYSGSKQLWPVLLTVLNPPYLSMQCQQRFSLIQSRKGISLEEGSLGYLGKVGHPNHVEWCPACLPSL
jgi:hypothetical protein